MKKEKTGQLKQSFMGGVLTLLIANIVIKIFGAVYRIVLTNIPEFGDVGNSIYGAGYKVYTILLALSTTGIPVALAKLVSEKDALKDYKAAHRLFKISLLLFSGIGFVCSIGFFLLSKQMSEFVKIPEAQMVMQVLAPAIFFVSVAAIFRGYFQGLLDMKPQARSQTIDQFVKCCGSIAFVFLFLSLGQDTKMLAVGATLGSTLGTMISLLYLLYYYNRYKKCIWKNIREQEIETEYEEGSKIASKLIRLAIPISLGAIITSIASLVDLATVVRLLIDSGITSERASELYGILTGKADVLVNLPLAINAVFATALVPAISGAMAVGDVDSASRKISLSVKTTLLITLPASIGIFVLSEPIVKALFPNAPNGADIVAISGLSVVFIALTQTLAGSLQGLGKVKVPVISLLVGAIIKFIINILVIPISSINVKGAAISSIVCYFVSSTISIIVLKKNIKLKENDFNIFVKPLIASILMGIGVYFINLILKPIVSSNLLLIFVVIIFAIIIYSILLIGLKILNEEEYKMFPKGEKIVKVLKKAKLL